MINVTTAFRKALYDEIREYENSVVITLANGTVLNVDNEHIMSNGLEIEDAISNDDDFTALGSTIINTATIVLYNNDEIYSDYDFVNAKVVVYTTLANERIKKGTFTIDDATYSNATITLYVLDNMEQFDRPYSLSNLTYPATLGEIVRDACQVCDVTLNSNSQQFPHYNFTIDERPDDESITFREVIGYAATIAGCYARCDVDGKLEFKWFNVAAFETDSSLDGGTFNPWTTGGYTDGGTFSPWTTGTEISDNEFTTKIIPHYITSLYSQDIGVDDVVITGVKIFIEVDDEEGGTETESYLAGSEGYIIQIENNPFINKSNVSTVLGWISTVVVGLRFRKCNVTHPNDPCIEAGDIGYVWDTKGVEHPILITRVTFSPNSPQTIVCGAQTPSRNSASRFSELTKSYVDARRQLRKQRDSYQAAMDDLKEQIDNANGLYETQVTQQDGSIITYLHNKPLLEESDTRIMISSVGVTVTPDAGQHWYGLTVDGTFIASIMNTIGINFDWGVGGALTIKDSNNNETFYVNANNGVVRIKASSFSLTDGTTLASTLQSAKSYADTAASNAYNNLTQQQVFNKLSNNGAAQGIWLNNGQLYFSFTYAQGGTLKLGGSNNGNGVLQIYNASGEVIGTLDNTGANLTGNITLKNGNISAFTGYDSTYVFNFVEWLVWRDINNFNIETRNNNVLTGKVSWFDIGSTYGMQTTRATSRSQFSEVTVVGVSNMASESSPSYSRSFIETYKPRWYAMEMDADSSSTAVQYILSTMGIRFRTPTGKIRIGISNTGEPIIGSTQNITSEIGTIDIESGNNKVDVSNAGIFIDGGSAYVWMESAASAAFVASSQELLMKASAYSVEIDSSGQMVNGRQIAFDSTSSKRYKHNITLLKNKTLDPHRLYDLVVKQYRYNDDAKLQYQDMKDKTLPGFIAEDVAKIYPAAVIHDNETGQVESWDERRIVPGMLALIQEQKKLIDELTERVNKLEGII